MRTGAATAVKRLIALSIISTKTLRMQPYATKKDLEQFKKQINAKFNRLTETIEDFMLQVTERAQSPPRVQEAAEANPEPVPEAEEPEQQPVQLELAEDGEDEREELEGVSVDSVQTDPNEEVKEPPAKRRRVAGRAETSSEAQPAMSKQDRAARDQFFESLNALAANDRLEILSLEQE